MHCNYCRCIALIGMPIKLLLSFFLVAQILSASGCGGSPSASLQSYDPQTAAAKAIELYDANADGKIAADELTKSPALAVSIRRLDGNRDGALTTDEIQARFVELDKWAKYVALDTTFTHRGRPLICAQITMSPEPFMGENYPTYTGPTLEGGTGALQPDDGREFPATPSGFYTVRVVHPGLGIDEVRGAEISDDSSGSRLMIALYARGFSALTPWEAPPS